MNLEHDILKAAYALVNVLAERDRGGDPDHIAQRVAEAEAALSTAVKQHHKLTGILTGSSFIGRI